MAKISLESLKNIILEEAVSLSEYAAKGADMSSDADAFDDPKKLKKMRGEAEAAIARLPVDHPDLASYVERLEGMLAGANTEQRLLAIKGAADIWHNRARRLMKWKRGEYEESDDMTESRADGSKRNPLKDVLAHLRPEDASDATHDAWAGGGDDDENLVAPVDQAKRQSGLETTEEQEIMPVAAIDERVADMSRSLASITRFSPEDHLAPHKPMSAMRSLADVMFEQGSIESRGSIVQKLEDTLENMSTDEAKEEVSLWMNDRTENNALTAVFDTLKIGTIYNSPSDLIAAPVEKPVEIEAAETEEVTEHGGEDGTNLILNDSDEISESSWLAIAGIK
jgi:hypothetical protein